jgi:hypothetical protein
MLLDILKNILKKKRPAESVSAEPYTPDSRVTKRPLIPSMAQPVPESPEHDLYQQQQSMVPQPTEYDVSGTTPMQPRPLVPQGPQSQLDTIYNKDYRPGGADRDKDWTTGDKVLSFLQGMFNGDGAIPSAMDRNYREKLADRKEMKRLIPQVNQQQDAQNHDLGVQRTQAQIADIDINNQIANRRIDVTQSIAEERASMKDRQQTWKEEDREQYWTWKKIELEAKRSGDNVKAQLAKEKQQEIERHNRVTEGQAAVNEQGRMIRDTNNPPPKGRTIKDPTIKAQVDADKKRFGVEKARQKAREGFVKSEMKTNGGIVPEGAEFEERVEAFLTAMGLGRNAPAKMGGSVK